MRNFSKLALIGTLRTLFDVAAAVAIVLFTLLSLRMPLPAIPAAMGAALLVVLVWALFLSPKPVLRTDRFARALVSLLLFASAAYSALKLGGFLPLVAVLFVLAATLTYLQLLLEPKMQHPGKR